MWLLLDMGNSSTKVALHDGASIHRHARFSAADPDRDTAFMEWVRDPEVNVDRAGAVSVVPGADDRWIALIRHRFGVGLEFFDHESDLPFELVYDTPETLGNDRIAAAAGAWQLGGREKDIAVIAVDTGTAVTYEVVTADSRYLPGPIAPGPALLGRAINAGTAQLPLVEPSMPVRLTGAGTEQAIQAGIMAGFIDAVDGMLERLVAETVGPVDIVLTGGWADWLTPRLAHEVVVEPDLVILGVRELMKPA